MNNHSTSNWPDGPGDSALNRHTTVHMGSRCKTFSLLLPVAAAVVMAVVSGTQSAPAQPPQEFRNGSAIEQGSGQVQDTTNQAGSNTAGSNTVGSNTAGSNTAGEQQENELSQFDGEAAFEVLKQVVAIGPRVSASEGMAQQRQFLRQHFEGLGATVFDQRFNVAHPNTGAATELANLAVRFHPDREKRLLICCHFDTRPFPDSDKVNPRGVFLGANDGASGVALLHELGKHMPGLEGQFGVDFIFFDGEEFVFTQGRDRMFLGSEFFANEYAQGRIPGRYTYAILVDMIGDKDLQIFYEGNSLGFADRLTRSIFGVAQRLQIEEFKPQQRHMIRDDHLPLNQIAGIPTCDLIDFDYPNPEAGNQYWHTTNDTVENCSADSVGKVGMVVLQWLREMQELNNR